MTRIRDLIWRNQCAICEVSLNAATPVCEACEGTLRFRNIPISREGAPDGLAICNYEEPAAKLLHNFKVGGVTALASYLAAKFCEHSSFELQISELHKYERMVLVPVPSSATATRQRGFVPAAMFANALKEHLSKQLKMPIETSESLWYLRAIKDQAGLKVEERAVNQRLSMTAGLSPTYRAESVAIVLVDDVVTSGASVREATRALAEAGNPPKVLFAFAETQQKWQHQG
ncbi:MAG: hypothetical protein RL556_394 [Actinomycetota bacterium]|jgi:predicted amidophosphoribosyltransferase